MELLNPTLEAHKRGRVKLRSSFIDTFTVYNANAPIYSEWAMHWISAKDPNRVEPTYAGPFSCVGYIKEHGSVYCLDGEDHKDFVTRIVENTVDIEYYYETLFDEE